jgi:transcriptional regulator with XRE-family HTH domain
MKQPELGKKILELRKAKGLTQEELVEKCNISVRTIQRIETGEVTPRVYTIKTILSALEYDLELIIESALEEKSLSTKLKEFFYIELDQDKPASHLTSQLNIAWIFGVIYFILALLEVGAEYYRFEENRMIFGNIVYIGIKVAVLISYFFFMRGLVLIGLLFKNYLLRIISYILILAYSVSLGYDIISLFNNDFAMEIILVTEALIFGALGIVLGIAFIRLNKTHGSIAMVAGIFELIAGFFLITVILALLGLVVLLPAILLEIILIYKTVEIIKEKQVSRNEI